MSVLIDNYLMKILTEHYVSAVEPAGDDGGDEELRAVGVLACICHGQKSGLSVLKFEVFI